MSIGGINAVTDGSSVAPTALSPINAPVVPGQPQGTTSLSSPAVLLSGLQQLAQSDPSKLTEVAGQASQQLRAAASSAGSDGQALTAWADAFGQVADTGDLSALHQVAARHGTHHRTATPLSSYSSTAATGSAGSSDADSTLAAVSEQVEQALGMNPPPFGPWGNEE